MGTILCVALALDWVCQNIALWNDQVFTVAYSIKKKKTIYLTGYRLFKILEKNNMQKSNHHHPTRYITLLES